MRTATYLIATMCALTAFLSGCVETSGSEKSAEKAPNIFRPIEINGAWEVLEDTRTGRQYVRGFNPNNSTNCFYEINQSKLIGK